MAARNAKGSAGTRRKSRTGKPVSTRRAATGNGAAKGARGTTNSKGNGTGNKDGKATRRKPARKAAAKTAAARKPTKKATSTASLTRKPTRRAATKRDAGRLAGSNADQYDEGSDALVSGPRARAQLPIPSSTFFF